MVKLVFAVFDKKSELHNMPFYKTTRGEALRDFQDLVQDERTVLYRHPEDFKLVELGTYEDKTGKFENKEPVTLAHAEEFKALRETPIGLVKGGA